LSRPPIMYGILTPPRLAKFGTISNRKVFRYLKVLFWDISFLNIFPSIKL